MSLLRRLPPPMPTPEQIAELERDFEPLRDANPGIPGDILRRTPEGEKVTFEWKRRHNLLPEQQPVIG